MELTREGSCIIRTFAGRNGSHLTKVEDTAQTARANACTEGCPRRDEGTIASIMRSPRHNNTAPRNLPPPRMLLYPRGVLARITWMRSPKGDDLWSSGDVAAMRSFPASLRPDGSRPFLREVTRC